ncbi:MAG: response regulator [Candidatus Magasanikbacteria bacterium]|nr:response regulator [Candidatus Magasanikbacteria bacterium]
MKILVVEDEPGLQRVLRNTLKSECYAVDVAKNGEQGAFLGTTGDYDLIILDNMLPKLSGVEVCKTIRKSGKKNPILILSAISEIEKKVEMLEAGADDYMSKPFSVDELLARIKALLRRPKSLSKEKIKIGNLSIDLADYTVKLNNKAIELTRKEFMLLVYLAKNKGNVMSRGKIMEHVWDINADPFSNTIESHILSLRKKIGDKGKNNIIKTVPGRGYKID